MKHPLDLQQLAETIAARGIAAVGTTTIDALTDHASHVGANPILIGIVGDPTAPAPARARAFGRLAGELALDRSSQFTVAA
jgi:hypothetical protein